MSILPQTCRTKICCFDRSELWASEGRSGARLKKLDHSGHVVDVELSAGLQSSWRISSPISVAHNGWHLHTWRFLWSEHWGVGVPSAGKGKQMVLGWMCLSTPAFVCFVAVLNVLPPHPTCTRAFLIPCLTMERCWVDRCSIFSDPEVAIP